MVSVNDETLGDGISYGIITEIDRGHKKNIFMRIQNGVDGTCSVNSVMHAPGKIVQTGRREMGRAGRRTVPRRHREQS